MNEECNLKEKLAQQRCIREHIDHYPPPPMFRALKIKETNSAGFGRAICSFN